MKKPEKSISPAFLIASPADVVDWCNLNNSILLENQNKLMRQLKMARASNVFLGLGLIGSIACLFKCAQELSDLRTKISMLEDDVETLKVNATDDFK